MSGRPPFPVDGYWLYLGGRPLIHLTRATLPASTGRVAPRIDHLALRVENQEEWSMLLARLARHQIDYFLTEVPLSNEMQLFVSCAPGVSIEFVAPIGFIRDGSRAGASPLTVA